MTDAPDTPTDAKELQRLREENEALRSRLETHVAKPERSWAWLAILLVVVGSVLLPVAVATTWIRTQVFSTEDYVAVVAPLAEDPAIQEAVADRIAEYVRDEFDLQGEVAGMDMRPTQDISVAVPGIEVIPDDGRPHCRRHARQRIGSRFGEGPAESPDGLITDRRIEVDPDISRSRPRADGFRRTQTLICITACPGECHSLHGLPP